TRLQGDWSSDVCSSDLAADPADVLGHLLIAHRPRALRRLAQLLARAPRAPAQDHIRVHDASFSESTDDPTAARSALLSSRLSTLPVALRGSSARKTTSRGTL